MLKYFRVRKICVVDVSPRYSRWIYDIVTGPILVDICLITLWYLRRTPYHTSVRLILRTSVIIRVSDHYTTSTPLGLTVIITKNHLCLITGTSDNQYVGEKHARKRKRKKAKKTEQIQTYGMQILSKLTFDYFTFSYQFRMFFFAPLCF